jgi:hypothetical protein
MHMKHLNLKPILFALFVLLSATSFAQSICDKQGPNARNQRIREKIYQNIKAIKAQRVADTSALRKEYMDIQVDINIVFGKMKNDLKLLTKKRKVCERYADELKPLIDTAEAINDKLLKALDRNIGAGLGVADLLSIIDWIWKKADQYKDTRKEEFYKELKWDDWDSIR